MEKADFPVNMVCQALGVSRSGYYAWLRRKESKRQLVDREALGHIQEVFSQSRGTYGSPRIYAALKAKGRHYGRGRIERLMRKHRITPVYRRRFVRTTQSKHGFRIAPNRLQRRFETEKKNEAWVTDLTYIFTGEGWLYLSVILDLYSRRIVGWAMSANMKTELPLAALKMAIQRRRPKRGLIHHSDRGVQYASELYQRKLRQHGIVCSMSKRGDCYDNAVVESFFSTLKRELVYRARWQTRAEARNDLFEYMEVFYNRKRRHSHDGYLSPVEYEDNAAKAA
jgi:transposase InsO family protein